MKKATEKMAEKKSVSPTDRHLELLKILYEARPDGITVQQLSKHFNKDKKTIRRYLDGLTKHNIPIQHNSAAHGQLLYWLNEQPIKLPEFDKDAAAALAIAHHFLSPVANSFLGKEITRKLKSIREKLGPAVEEKLDDLLEIFQNSIPGWKDYEGKADIIDTIATASERKKRVDILYASPRDGFKEERDQIDPYTIITHDGMPYVLCFSKNRNNKRLLKLNRIREAEPTKLSFKKPTAKEIESWRNRGFGVFAFGEKPIETVLIRVTGYMATYVQEHKWHKTQLFVQKGENDVIMQFMVEETPELINWIMSLRGSAEVLEPKSLRETIKKEIANMAKIYAK